MENSTMKKILNDDEAEFFIQEFYEANYETDEECSLIVLALDNYQQGLVDILISSKPLLSPKEALRLARERNKPILL
jgi:hypothetical protein